MDTGTHNVGKIFGQDCRYMVPLFQRPYVWNEEDQWQPLWDDVRTVAERLIANQPTRPHFLGAIVLDQLRKPTGHVESRLVIDGQQRLTTIQILLEAFADLTLELKQEKQHKALLKLTRNDDPLSVDPDEVFKVWPTNVDRDVYRSVMLDGSPAQVRERLGVRANKKRVGQPVPDAYFYFHEVIGAWLAPASDGFDARLGALIKAVKDYLRLVVIDLGPEDDAQLIFETLNARGTPLLPMDLVKNFLFHRAEQEKDDLQQLFDRWWKPFDADAKYWREKVGRGHAKRPRMDLYLQHFLALQLRDEVKVANMYHAFLGMVESKKELRAAQHMERLRYYASIFQAFDNESAEGPASRFFQRLRVMDMTTAHPFLMELVARYGKDSPITNQVLQDLESYLVRRLVCQLSTRGYGRFFLDALPLFELPREQLVGAVRERLLSSDAESTRWPTDTELRDAWLTLPFASLGRGRVEMVMLALEARVTSGKTEKVKFDGKLTIEHLMPEKWKKYWPLPESDDPDEAEGLRNRIIQTVGNLTLLTKKLNSSVSNGPWEKKREGVLSHSILKLNLRLKDAATWDEASIRARGTELFDHAKAIWPRPAQASNKS
jgi:hypothetical protein